MICRLSILIKITTTFRIFQLLYLKQEKDKTGKNVSIAASKSNLEYNTAWI